MEGNGQGRDKIRGGGLHPPRSSPRLQVPPSPCEGAEGRCLEGIRQVVAVAMEKAAGQRHLIGGGGGGKKAAPPAMGLQKQNSWSPDIERDEAWERRRRGMRRGGTALRRVRSVTDDDLDELRGCIDLGFGFEPPPAGSGSGSGSGCAACGCAGRNRLVETLPALDLYYAVHGGADGVTCTCGAASEVSSEESPLGSPMSILSPGDPPETVKMRLKQWAQVVALSMLSRH